MSTTIAARGSSPRMRVATVAMVFAFVATSFSVVLPHAVRAADASLVGYWTMNEASGTTAADTGALPANPLTTVGSPTFVPGKIGNALALSGSRNPTTPDEASLDLTTAITMAAWVKPGAAATQDLIAKEITPTPMGINSPLLRQAVARARRLSDSITTLQLSRSTTSYPTDEPLGSMSPRTYNGTTIRIYYNGTQEISASRPHRRKRHRLRHRRPEQQPAPFTGAMDDVRIYNRALSSTEVQQLAANTACRTPDPIDHHAPGDSGPLSTASDDGLPNPPAALPRRTR